MCFSNTLPSQTTFIFYDIWFVSTGFIKMFMGQIKMFVGKIYFLSNIS